MIPIRNDPLQEEHQRLQADNDHYLMLIRKEKQHLTSLDMKMKGMQARLLEKKKATGGRTCTLRRSRHQRKHISVMEDRVNQATTRFDRLLCGNQALRARLDNLRRQRGTFSSIYQRLNRDLRHQHHVMEGLVEKSVLAYDQRSEALARMLAVRERSKKDTSVCHTEMTELTRVIDHYSKLRHFMVKKSQEVVPMGEDEDAKKRKSEQAQRERMGGESLETYQAVYRLIVKTAGEKDLRTVGKKFKENEEKSFAYFNYINELNNKSTMLNDRINKLRKDILHFELENKQHDVQWQSKLKDLEGELEQKRGLANGLESQYAVIRKFLEQQKIAVADLFAKMNCDPTAVTGRLGCSAQLNDDNVTQFIGILEGGVQGLLMTLAQSSYKEAEEMELPPQNPLLTSFSLLPGPSDNTHPSTEAPCSSTWEDSATDGLLGNEMPLDFQTLCERVLPHVVQTEQGTAATAASGRCLSSAAQRAKKKVGFGPKSA